MTIHPIAPDLDKAEWSDCLCNANLISRTANLRTDPAEFGPAPKLGT
jgi:hypothetical protein